MPTKLEFTTPEGRIALSISDVQFMAYDAGELALQSTRDFVERMRSMGLGELAERYAGLLAQNKVSVMELREAREDAEMLLGSKDEGGAIAEQIMPRLEALRETITRTQADMRASGWLRFRRHVIARCIRCRVIGRLRAVSDKKPSVY